MCLNKLSLFGLDGVGWSHVVAGDVTFLPGVDGASLPPVAFPGGKRVSKMDESVKQLNLRTFSHVEFKKKKKVRMRRKELTKRIH